MFNIIESYKRTKKLKRISQKKPDTWVLPEQKLAVIKHRKIASRSVKTAIIRYILEQKGEVLPNTLPLELKNKIDAEYSHYLTTQTLHEMREEYFIISIIRKLYLQ